MVTCSAIEGVSAEDIRKDNFLADRAAQQVLREMGEHSVIQFDPGNGSDERGLLLPGFDLPVASVMRTMYSGLPEYHTSNDDKWSWILLASTRASEAYEQMVDALEHNLVWSKCVRSASATGQARANRHRRDASFKLDPTMWMLNLADGVNDLLAIAERSGDALAGLVGAPPPSSQRRVC